MPSFCSTRTIQVNTAILVQAKQIVPVYHIQKHMYRAASLQQKKKILGAGIRLRLWLVKRQSAWPLWGLRPTRRAWWTRRAVRPGPAGWTCTTADPTATTSTWRSRHPGPSPCTTTTTNRKAHSVTINHITANKFRKENSKLYEKQPSQQTAKIIIEPRPRTWLYVVTKQTGEFQHVVAW